MLQYFYLSILFITVIPTFSVAGPDDLFILLDEISVFGCRGVQNEVRLREEDVNIVNEKGNKVYYIRAPGNYSLHFGNIKVLKNLGHLTGEIGVTLQVPVLEGPAGIRFDVPYTMIPETGLLNQQCDEFSGIVERDKRQYCRYCELCGLSAKIESGLTQGQHKILPELAQGRESAFSPHCSKISSDSYEFQRTLNLPGRQELENMIKGKVQGVDNEIKKRLNKGRGRFQVFLNLIAAEQPPISQKAWFDGSEQCKCCGREKGPSCNPLGFLYCNAEDCKSAWAQQCLHNSARIAACFTVEFNYRMTTSYADVQKFIAENKYPNQDAEPAPTPPPPPPQPAAPVHSLVSPEQGGVAADIPTQCVQQIPLKSSHLRRYCTIFWNQKLCCANCPGVC